MFHNLREVLQSQGLNTAVGDEGGFNLDSNKQYSSDYEAIKAGYEPGEDVCIALDVAATELFKDGKYELAGRENFDTDEMVAFTKI